MKPETESFLRSLWSSSWSTNYVLCNSKLQYCIHRIVLTELTESNMIYLIPILILFPHPYIGLPSGLFSSYLLMKPCHSFISQMCDTLPAHLSLHDLVTLIIFNKELNNFSVSCHLLSLRSKYTLWRFIPIDLKCMLFPWDKN